MWFPPKATAEKYQELLEFALHEYGDEINEPYFIFQYGTLEHLIECEKVQRCEHSMEQVVGAGSEKIYI